MSTHLRTILLKKKSFQPAAIPPDPIGPVTDLGVTTPHVSNSGVATATFLSPVGETPGTLDYFFTLTGGPGVVSIVSITPVQI